MFSRFLASSKLSGYPANGTDFNGSFYLNSDSAIAIDGGQFTISLWFKKSSSSSGGTLFQQQIDTPFGSFPAIYLQINSAESVNIDINSFGGNPLLARSTGSSSAIDGEWNHYMASYRSSSLAGHVYLNGDSYTPSLQSGTIPFSSGNLGNRIGGSINYSNFDGTIAEFWLNNSYIDLSQASNRAKFYNSKNLPISLGDSGELPTGSSPLCYFPLNFLDGIPNLDNNRGTVTTFANAGSGATDGGEVTPFL